VKNVLITGSKGRIGRVIKAGLKDNNICDFDLPEFDAIKAKQYLKLFKQQDIVIHLASRWDSEGWLRETVDPYNTQLVLSILECVRLAKVPKLILASSVQIDDFYHHNTKSLIRPLERVKPPHPYGAHKALFESLGRELAKNHGTEVIAIRFGGVQTNNKPLPHPFEDAVWLSHGDCQELIRKIVNTPPVSGRFTSMYAVSNNLNRLHDTINPFGWKPVDDSSTLKVT